MAVLTLQFGTVIINACVVLTRRRLRSAPGPDLPLLFKLHDIWLVYAQKNH